MPSWFKYRFSAMFLVLEQTYMYTLRSYNNESIKIFGLNFNNGEIRPLHFHELLCLFKSRHNRNPIEQNVVF